MHTLLQGLYFCKFLGLSNLEMEGDALGVIKASSIVEAVIVQLVS